MLLLSDFSREHKGISSKSEQGKCYTKCIKRDLRKHHTKMSDGIQEAELQEFRRNMSTEHNL